MAERILFSTTSNLEGWEIQEYLGTISAQFVIGTGVIAEFFSAWTDFFGIHSRSYQKKLDRINEEALSLLHYKATRIRANAVIGLRIDHDEISGMGKSMLMVTAIGTAVRAQRLGANASIPNATSYAHALSADDLRHLIKRKQMLEQAKAGTLKYDDDTWRFLIDNRVEECAPFVLAQLKSLYDEYYRIEDQFKIACREYFHSLPVEGAKAILYECIGKDEPLSSFALSIIRDRNLFDAELMLRGLDASDIRIRKRYLHLVNADAAVYTADDIELLEAVVHKIETAFPVLGEVFTKEAKLFGSTKKMWRCPCGNEVPATTIYCPKCFKDARGLDEKDPKPENAVRLLQEKIEVLKAALGQPVPVI